MSRVSVGSDSMLRSIAVMSVTTIVKATQ